MPQNKRFTKAEIDFMLNNYKLLSVKELADSLDRSEDSVRDKLERIHVNLSNLERNTPRKWTSDEIAYIRNNYTDMSDAKISHALGIPVGQVCRKRLSLGLVKHTYSPYIQQDYYLIYKGGHKVFLHKLIMSEHLGRPLTKDEKVHHIDGDKLHNDISNLYLCKDRSAHGNVHASLSKVAFQLVRSGVIKFDPTTGEYHL